MALLGHGATSDLSPLCAQLRTLLVGLHHRSRASFRRLPCVSLRSGSNGQRHQQTGFHDLVGRRREGARSDPPAHSGREARPRVATPVQRRPAGLSGTISTARAKIGALSRTRMTRPRWPAAGRCATKAILSATSLMLGCPNLGSRSLTRRAFSGWCRAVLKAETRRLVTAHERGGRKFSTESDGTPKHRKLTLSF